jgi:DNA helicase II / ATP-dependent DNA helicase PcrA
MMNYSKRYNKLNDSQKQAVDTIDGPLMVVAGPGTGKTELLSMRTANILRQTDTLPENILCLTYTDSGAASMRERLTEIIGKDAYKVSIHTFHSFGSEVINQNGEYFYQGADFRPADTLSSYQIVQQIFDNLDHTSLINAKQNDRYVHIKDTLTVISELKKSGLTDDELSQILENNDHAIQTIEDLLAPIFGERISAKTAPKLLEQIPALRAIPSDITVPTVTSLGLIVAESLEQAVDKALNLGKTTPVTAWKTQWFEKDARNCYVLKARKRQVKLREVIPIYQQYIARMRESSLYDFDDMILRVVQAMEIFDDLRLNLQEKYQYIMVDEFQDTNMAQMRILECLISGEVVADTPNIMVVGDDDQAIYSFQGAEISNIIDFRKKIPRTKIITLTENYRSTAQILDGSRDIIVLGHNRLEGVFEDIDKKLSANVESAGGGVSLHQAEDINDERAWLASDIKARIESGQDPTSIAVLTRKHDEIKLLLPYFAKAGIAVTYERQDNVLELAPIKLITQLSRLLIALSVGNHGKANDILPEIIAHKAWGVAPAEIMTLSMDAYDNKRRWLDAMADRPVFTQIYTWLVETSALINQTPLEQMLDIIVGRPDDDSSYHSPIYEYYFGKDKIDHNPTDYVIYLEALRKIRSALQGYRPGQDLTLDHFIEFIDLNGIVGSTISLSRQSIGGEKAINVLTAHKSKGLEYDSVYVMNAVDTVWGEHAHGRSRLISYPENLKLAPAGESEDERLRLFYVATTRAKKNLHISYSLRGDSGKKTERASFLVDTKWPVDLISPKTSVESMEQTAELAWYQPITSVGSATLNDLLLPMLENYKLSATHLNTFTDVARGGPKTFLLNNLLHFPSAKSPHASFGTAIHSTLNFAHTAFIATGRLPDIQEITAKFEAFLQNQRLSAKDEAYFKPKGESALKAFFEQKAHLFDLRQKSELGFSSQHSILGDAHLTGSLDLVDIDKDKKTIIVTDYKTGKPHADWKGDTAEAKIKLHKYRQQILFYKLLVENSRDYHNYRVERGVMQFVEPNAFGEILDISTDFDSTELERLKLLIASVWNHIKQLNLPDTSHYPATIKGVLAFEQDLIDGVI